MRIRICLAIPMALCGLPASGGIIVFDNFLTESHAGFAYQGTTYSQNQVNVGNSSQAIAGNSSIPELRTAARVNSTEIAANARSDDHFTFSGINIGDSSDLSSAEFVAYIVETAGTAEHLAISFYIPPSYVEVSSFVEAPDAILAARITADIRVSCADLSNPVCDASKSQFSFLAQLDASFDGFSKIVTASGQPGLDLTPLFHPVITDTWNAFGTLRTTNLAFPAFSGTLDLGQINIATPMNLGYTLEALVAGTSENNVGIASINDPFFFDSDPVQRGAPVSVADAVPEPSTGGLLFVGLLLCGIVRRLRRIPRGNFAGPGRIAGRG